MIDHIGFPVSDYARSKAFYEKALAPLGYTLIMEVGGDHTESGSPAAGFGKDGKPDFWIGGEGGLTGMMHVAIGANDRRTVDAFHRAALAAGGLVFTGFTDGTFVAYDDTTLEQLWKINVGIGFNAPPMTFEVNGKQYVAILSGLSPIARGKHQLIPELKEQRNQTMLFVFGL